MLRIAGGKLETLVKLSSFLAITSLPRKDTCHCISLANIAITTIPSPVMSSTFQSPHMLAEAAATQSTTFIRTPVLFSVEMTGSGNDTIVQVSEHMFKNGNMHNNDKNYNIKKVPGTFVTSPDFSQSSAKVLCLNSKVDGKRCGRAWISTKTATMPTQDLTIDFGLPSESQNTAVDSGQANLIMSVSNGLLLPTQNSVNTKRLELCLLTAPGATTLTSIQNSGITDDNGVGGINWKQLVPALVQAVPVIAGAGLEIYSSLKSTEANNNETPINDFEGFEGFWDTLTQVAQVAVPIAGSLIGSAAKALLL